MTSLATSLPLEDSMTDGGVLGLTDEKLEKVFREIEEASERRALEEEEEEASHPGPLLDPFVSAALANNAELALSKKRRRQSISVSRVGSYPDVPAELHHTGSGPGSPVPWAAPPLYRANTNTSTTSSLSTVSSFASSHERRHVEENHTTQIETIAGRRNTLTKAMSSALSRTLTRMRSRGAINEILPDDEALVIDVARTEETTVDLSSSQEIGPGVGGAAMTATVASVTAGEGEKRRRSAMLAGAGGVGGELQILTETHTHVEITDPISSEAGPSRRMSITVSAGVGLENGRTGEVTRSRSGSLNKLRGKRPLRATASASADIRPSTPDVPAGIMSGADDSEKEIGKVHVSEVASEFAIGVGNISGGRGAGANAKPARRLSYFAKAFAQRLRRRKSGEESDKEQGKDKHGDREKGKVKSDQSSQKSSEKSTEKLTFVLPAPISTNSDIARHLDQPIIKSPLLAAAPSFLVDPTPSSSSNTNSSVSTGGGLIVSTNTTTTLPPSPRRLPSANEVPLPPSPAGSPRSPSTSSVVVPGVVIRTDLEPTKFPLPPSPIVSTFAASGSKLDDASKRGLHRSSATRTSQIVGTLSASIPIPSTEGKRRRLPPSALPDSDFGPMGEITPAPTPSPTESTMSVGRRESGLGGGEGGGEDVRLKESGGGERDREDVKDGNGGTEIEVPEKKGEGKPEDKAGAVGEPKAELELSLVGYTQDTKATSQTTTRTGASL